MRVRLDDQTWVAAGNRLVKLSMLPPGYRVRNILLHCELSGTKDAADALAANSFPLFLQSIKLGRMVDSTGVGLRDLNRLIHGRITCGGTAIPGSGTTFSITTDLIIPFHDPRQQGPTDGAVPTELLMPKSLELNFAAAAVYAVGNLVITAGTVRVDADLIHESCVPQLCEIGFQDPGGQTIQLPGGIYKDLWITDGSGIGTITPAEISSVDFFADGGQILNNALHQQIVADYNSGHLRDTADALAFATADFLPVQSVPLHNGQLTKCPAVEKTGMLQLAGTLTAPRVHYWRVALKDQATVEAVARATGFEGVGTVAEPQVASKSPVRAMNQSVRENRVTKKARLMYAGLPTKLRKTPTPGSV